MTKNVLTGIFAALLAAFGLLLGCVDPEDAEGSSGTGGTSLYVFDSSDGASSRILVYSDVATLFNDPETSPSRQLRGTKIEKVKNLAWGGMCFDTNGNRLYLVSEAGDVVRIDRVRSQNGDISSPFDIVSFMLGSSDSERLSNGKFGQAMVNPMTSALYVTESNSSSSRVWVISNPGALSDGATVGNSGYLSVPGEKGGTGVAVGTDGSIYAYLDDGSFFTDPLSGVSYSGPRLRKGNSAGFPLTTSVIVGDSSEPVNKTKLARYGCLAVDSDGYVYMSRHLWDAGLDTSGSEDSILVFSPGQFNPGRNQAPERTFSNTIDLRIISHAVTRDWLVGASSNGDFGRDRLWIWRAPSSVVAMSSKDFSVGSGAAIRGLALDGNN
ncbi:MAG: hypothetical protein FWG12_04470 [Holophagaceae bacterium]|nr:hypothetical protein [Holophagaceae bacterium]